MKLFLARLWRFLGLPKNIQLFIMRFREDQFLIGLTGIIFNKKNEVLLLRHTYRATAWSLPGGYMKGKEHPEEGLAREIEEETGFVVSIDSRFKVRTDRETARLDFCYVGTFIGGDFCKSHEIAEANFFAFDDIPEIRTDQLLVIKEALEKRTKTPLVQKSQTLAEKFKRLLS